MRERLRIKLITGGLDGPPIHFQAHNLIVKESVNTMTTTGKETPARKATPSKRAPAKPAVKADAVAKPAEVPVLRKKELIERVVARSGIKKKDAKPVIEAMLAVLGEALASGEDLNLQPLGKVMVKRVKEHTNAKVMVTRIRQRNAVGDAKVVKIPT